MINTKKIIIPICLILIILLILKNVFAFRNNSFKEEPNNETVKNFETQINGKDISLVIKNQESKDSLLTPYSLIATNKNDGANYSSQTIDKDRLEGMESIKTKTIGNETLIVIDGLSVGSHSSGLRVFKIDPDKKEISSICVRDEKQIKDDPCFFSADAMSEPFFEDVDGDKNDELVEMNKSLKDPQINVLTAVYEFKNNSFIPLIDKEYEKAYQYLSKSFINGNDNESFKLIRNFDNKN